VGSRARLCSWYRAWGKPYVVFDYDIRPVMTSIIMSMISLSIRWGHS
jgi:hypothetical protein